MKVNHNVPADLEAIALAVAACRAAGEKKATDLVVLEVADILAVVDLFMLASTGSDRQLKAVTDEIEQGLREEHDRRPIRREGTPESGWVLLDYGDIVCHVFLAAQRAHYDLERLWSDVARIDTDTGEHQPPAIIAAVEDGR